MQPDFYLAYQLAAASYCAYTIGELDPDHNYARAVDCLKAAAAADPKHLGIFASDIAVEVYLDPASPQDAYLLIREQRGVILAFRGTLAPPLSPSSRYLFGAAADTVAKYNLQAGAALKSFVADWINNIKVVPTLNGRHSGFDTTWQRLLNHLSNDCRVNSAGVTTAQGECSRLLEFLEEKKYNNPDRRLFVTGHSKGGAVATLATLDLPKLVGPDTIIVTYTFEAPKSLTLEFVSSAAAASIRDELQRIWRFEYKDDLVPLVPLDKSSLAFPLFVPFAVAFDLKAYTQVGRGLFMEVNKVSASSGTPSDELPKLKEFFDDANIETATLTSIFDAGLSPTRWWAKIASRLQTVGAAHCRQLVDNHFAVFAAVQQVVWARDGVEGRPGITTAIDWDRSFFAVGIPDRSGTVMWGFRQWCDHLDVH